MRLGNVLPLAAALFASNVSALEMKGLTIGQTYSEHQLRQTFGHVECHSFTTGRSRCDVPTTVFGRDVTLEVHRDSLGHTSALVAILPKEDKEPVVRILEERYGPSERPEASPMKCAIWRSAKDVTGSIKVCDLPLSTWVSFGRADEFDPNDI